MAQPETITSRQNPRVKNLAKLRERSHRLRQERFVVEGVREFSMALHNGYAFEEVYLCAEMLQGETPIRLAEEAAMLGAEVTRLSTLAFEKVSGRENPDGLLGVAVLPERVVDSLKLPEAPILVVVEGVEKPGNIGAIIRSAEGAGASAVIVASEKADIYSPQIIRNSRGLVFSLPVVSETPEYLLNWLRKRELPLVATTPSATKAHWDTDFSKGAALLLGAEHQGLSDFWLKAATEHILVPLKGQADSLNVSATAAIVLYEALRQRSQV